MLVLFIFLLPTKVLAITDPLSVPNNKFGIHIISATPDEASPSADLVNSSGGDWGYVTVLIEDKDLDRKDNKYVSLEKWQKFFDYLRVKHLIPIIRLATHPEGNFWKRPQAGLEKTWADFLDMLIWPTQNRYVVIYNEPNHGKEWDGQVDPGNYAQVLNTTIDALKAKNDNFFVLNAGFDASAPSQPPDFEDEDSYLRQMNESVPGIFNKLDGWVSHSYPNPNFAGSPKSTGKGTIRTFEWEGVLLKNLGVEKKLPIFITETGWQHSEGLVSNRTYPTTETVGLYLKDAFTHAWSSDQIVMVSPFLLNYQESPFDHFSFKKLTGQKQNQKILGVSYPEYYPHYEAMANLAKTPGQPKQLYKAVVVKGGLYPSVVKDESYIVPVVVKNIGNSIWNEYESISLQAIEGGEKLNIENASPETDKKVEPGQDGVFNLKIHAPDSGSYNIKLALFHNGNQFDQPPFEYKVTVKKPVSLQVAVNGLFGTDPSGEYILNVTSEINNSSSVIYLDKSGKSEVMETKYLLPDYTYTLSLKKAFYKANSLTLTLQPGVNFLHFGTLNPDLLSVIYNTPSILGISKKCDYSC